MSCLSSNLLSSPLSSITQRGGTQPDHSSPVFAHSLASSLCWQIHMSGNLLLLIQVLLLLTSTTVTAVAANTTTIATITSWYYSYYYDYCSTSFTTTATVDLGIVSACGCYHGDDACAVQRVVSVVSVISKFGHCLVSVMSACGFRTDRQRTDIRSINS